MKTTKYLLIGGGLSCARAAKAIRQIDREGGITLVGAEAHAPYDRPPLSKAFMQGKKRQDQIPLEKASFWLDQKIDMIVGQTVEHLDPSRKTATLARGQIISYEKALLATGGRPVRLHLPGEDLPNVHYFRTLDDAIGVSAQVKAAGRAVVLGGGFISAELAASLTQRGMSVTLVQRGAHLWSRFAGPSLGDYFQNYCVARGVSFATGDNIAKIEGNGLASSVVLQSGHTLPCDMVCIAVGIVPNVELARQAGLKIDDGVVVDEYMRTSDEDIFAAGDIANYPDPYCRRRRRVEHWGQADYTGALAGQNMAGQRQKYDLLTYVWSDLFDLHLEFAGDERDYDKQIIRGRMEDNAFSVLYLKAGRMTAYFAINLPKEQYTLLGKLIEQKTDLTGRETQLQDAKSDLRQLLPAPQPAGVK